MEHQTSVLFTAAGIDTLKSRIADHAWVESLWLDKLATLDQVAAEPVVLPERGGGWWHWYASPDTGAPLKTGERIGTWEWEHIDTVTGKVYRGDRSQPQTDYDLCVLMGVHDAFARNVRDLGVAWQVTGTEIYAAKAREIILAYADTYLTYALHSTRNVEKVGGGRVGPQTLDESVWLIPFCQGADLLWGTMSDEERGRVTEKLIYPATRDVILPHEMGVHNIQCWKNSAVGCAGYLLGDDTLVAEALENPERGFRRQMAEGVKDDGAWWEGAWGYHFYTLSSLWGLMEAARNNGLDLYDIKYKKMYDAPLQFAMPDYRLPAFNDSGEVSIRGRGSLYELAYTRFGDPGYAALLSQCDRSDDYALYFGAGSLPEPGPRTASSVNYSDSGYAILSRGEGEAASWLCLKYGPHGGGHGHPDKLNFVLYSKGEVLGVDPGAARYGLPQQSGWYKTSVAHNTLVVDGRSQERSEGKCLAFGNENGVDYVVAEGGPIYEGVRFSRTAAMLTPDLFVFVDFVTCEAERELDLIYHHRGKWSGSSPGTPWSPPDLDGYRYLADTVSQDIDGGFEAAIEHDGISAHLSMIGGPTEVITGTGVGDNLEDRVPVLLFRRQAQETAYLWALSLDGPARLSHVPLRGATPGQAACVRVSAGEQIWTLVANPKGRVVELVDGSGTDGIFSVF